MKTCTICGERYDAKPDVCIDCYYAGAPLEKAFAAELVDFARVTDSDWHAEHTGGGCFWLHTVVFGGHLTLTTWPEVMSCSDTPATIEEHGWFLVATPTRDWEFGDSDACRAWPSDDASGNTPERGLSTGALHFALVEAVDFLDQFEANILREKICKF